MLKFVTFHAFSAMPMKNIIFWDVATCTPIVVVRSFGGTLNKHGDAEDSNVHCGFILYWIQLFLNFFTFVS
jgi:hypothetical protein